MATMTYKYLIVKIIGYSILASSFVNQFALADKIILDDFNSENIRLADPLVTDSKKRLWHQYENDFTEGPDPGVESISNIDNQGENKALNITVSAGNVYLNFYPYENYQWDYLNEQTLSGIWTNNTFNRLKFWVKLPEGVTMVGGGRKNTTFGTYIRSSDGDRKSAESGGGHFYHNFDLESSNTWQQVIIDMHPDHERGANGSVEQEFIPYRTGEEGFNYFDSMTRFYFEIDGGLPNYPAAFMFDDFELYFDKNDENVEQIYSVTGHYKNESNELALNWRRRKDEGTITHEVRYSFDDIHNIGWDNAIPAPNGVVTPPNKFSYNGMSYKTDQIEFLANENIYLAIKPSNSNRFRQINIPKVPPQVTEEQSTAIPPPNFSVVK